MSRNDLSIHPRNWPGVGNGKKTNTCRPKSTVRIERAIDGITKHIDENPGDDEAKRRLANLRAKL